MLGRATGRTAVGLPPPTSGYAPFGDEWEDTGASFAVVVGGDIGYAIHPHLEIVTQAVCCSSTAATPSTAARFRVSACSTKFRVVELGLGSGSNLPPRAR